MPFYPMYNNELVLDNEFGALDNETLKILSAAKAEEDKRSSMSTKQRAEQDIIDSLKDQAEAQRAIADAIKAQQEAQAALAAAQKAKADAEAEARRKAAEEEARRKAEEEARRRAEEEARRKQNDRYDTNYGTSVSSTPATPSTISSKPSNISPVTQTPPPPPVKTAPIDTILFDNDTVPIEIMADLIFENIGGQELINIARNDTVNGQQIIYQPIKNLTQIQQEYNPNNIVALQATSDKYFQNFAIKFDSKVPEEGTGENGAHVYIDPETGSLVIEAINLDSDEQIELEISTSGTIYEAEI